MLPLFLEIKSISQPFSRFDQHIITFVSPLKAFCFNRWCHIQLRNKFPAPIMSIMSLFPDQIVSTHHMDFVDAAISWHAAVYCKMNVELRMKVTGTRKLEKLEIEITEKLQREI
jgi:hypothetical protein